MKQYPKPRGLVVLCELFGKSRQAYYKQSWQDRYQDMSDAIILCHVRELRRTMPRLGTRKLHFLLSTSLDRHGLHIGRDRLFDLLSSYGLLVRRRKRRKAITTDSNHPFKRYPNLIKGMVVNRANQLWVSDITYVSQGDGFSYLSLITDAYSRKIIGYHLSTNLKKEGPLLALEMALGGLNRCFGSKLIHHSDRGLQYCSGSYIRELESHQVSISMTEKGDPYENAIAERVNGILKDELGLDKTYGNYQLASVAVAEAIDIYNRQRPHGSCNYLTPHQAHTQQGDLKKKWRSASHRARTTSANITSVS